MNLEDVIDKILDSVHNSVHKVLREYLREGLCEYWYWTHKKRKETGTNLEPVEHKIWHSVINHGDSVIYPVRYSVCKSVWNSVRKSVWRSVWRSVGDFVDFGLQEPIRKERRIQERAGK